MFLVLLGKKKKEKPLIYPVHVLLKHFRLCGWQRSIYTYLIKFQSIPNFYFFMFPYLFIPSLPFKIFLKIIPYICLFIFSIHFVLTSTHPVYPVFALGNDDSPTMTTTMTTESVNICWAFAMFHMLWLPFFLSFHLYFSPCTDTFVLYFELWK